VNIIVRIANSERIRRDDCCCCCSLIYTREIDFDDKLDRIYAETWAEIVSILYKLMLWCVMDLDVAGRKSILERK